MVSVTTLPMLLPHLVAPSIHSRPNGILVPANLASNLGGLVTHRDAQKHPDAFGVIIVNRLQRLARFELHIRARLRVGDNLGQ